MPSSVRTFLARPRTFFERRADRLSGVSGAVLAAAIAAVTVLVLGVALWLFTRQFTGTATVDNPAYPGDVFCGDDAVGGMAPSGCAEPATVERPVSGLLWAAVVDVLPWLFVGLWVVWLGLALALHAGARVAGGDGSLGETMAVTAWGLVPTVVVSVLGAAILVTVAGGMDLSAGSPETLERQVRALEGGVSGVSFLAVQLLGAAWQAVVWTGGLRAVHGLGRAAAVTLAVLAATVPVVLS